MGDPSSARSPSPTLVTEPGRSLVTDFLVAAAKHGSRTALVAEDRTLTYAELAERAGRVARRLASIEVPPGPRLGAIFGDRGSSDFVGILGTLLSGSGYVPLNTKFPDERNAYILNVTGASSLVVDAKLVTRLDALLPQVKRPLTVVLPDGENVAELASRHPTHVFLGREDLAAAVPLLDRPRVDTTGLAYLTFTSGSTGVPKGVMETHVNILHHLDACQEIYEITEEDRVSQTFDMTFDPTLFDIFATFGRGASLHVLSQKVKRAPDRFIKEHELTVWFCVPSVVQMMRAFKLIRPGDFPSLRLSLFVGERLLTSVAAAWQEAAPSSRVENVYGPTETTNVCTRYVWKGEASMGESFGGGVPIGVPFPGTTLAIVDDHGQPVGVGVKGELCIRGPQVTPGYWQDEARTVERFGPLSWDAGPQNRWYRTGDLGFLRPDGVLVHCGRNDEQVKVQGYRLELGEVEHALRSIAKTEALVVIATSRDGGVSHKLTGVLAQQDGLDSGALLDEAKRRLPTYMVPQKMVVLPELPLNSNGKIDKRAITALLERSEPPEA